GQTRGARIMKAVVIRYLNEIVSLAVMALMSVALIAGQADATAHAVALESEQHEVGPALIHAEFAIDLNLGELAKLNVDKDSIEAIREVLETRLERRD
ncbi:MAG: hypothetical protein ACR2QS_01690, partial [Woeseiaceae bacterium]